MTLDQITMTASAWPIPIPQISKFDKVLIVRPCYGPILFSSDGRSAQTDVSIPGDWTDIVDAYCSSKGGHFGVGNKRELVIDEAVRRGFLTDYKKAFTYDGSAGEPDKSPMSRSPPLSTRESIITMNKPLAIFGCRPDFHAKLELLMLGKTVQLGPFRDYEPSKGSEEYQLVFRPEEVTEIVVGEANIYKRVNEGLTIRQMR